VVTADGSGSVPAVGIKANLNGLSLKPFLVAAAGFDMVEGSGGIDLNVAGAGGDLQSLMDSLAGSGKFNFDDGLIKGVNLTELGNAAKTALSTKSLPANVFGASQQTRFSDLAASFSMKDGVAAMSDLKIDAGPFNVSGGGSLDIGAQKLSLSLFPEFKDKKSGFNGFAPPLKLAGGWSGVQVGVDWDWLVQKATSSVTSKVTNEIQDELKKQLGADFGNLFGNKPAQIPQAPASSTAPAPSQPAEQRPAQPSETAQPEQTPAQQPQSVEDRLKQEADKALGRLLGTR
jgi:AsmA protein